MYIIVGLGNPGSQYAHTRHNVGFDVIDVLAEQYGISVDHKKCRALCGKGRIGGQPVVLAKPQTYMNLSGESVRQLIDFYKVDKKENHTRKPGARVISTPDSRIPVLIIPTNEELEIATTTMRIVEESQK